MRGRVRVRPGMALLSVRAARAAEGVGPYGASAKTGCRAGTCAPPSRVPECGGPRVAALRQVIIKCGDNGAPHPPLARSPFPRGGRFWCGGCKCIHLYTNVYQIQLQLQPRHSPAQIQIQTQIHPQIHIHIHPHSQKESGAGLLKVLKMQRFGYFTV